MNPKRKPKRTPMERDVYKKHQQIVTLTDEQSEYFTNRPDANANISKGIRSFLAWVEWGDRADKPTVPPGKRRCVTLCSDDITKLKQLGGSVNKGLQVAWANYVSPKLTHFFRD